MGVWYEMYDQEMSEDNDYPDVCDPLSLPDPTWVRDSIIPIPGGYLIKMPTATWMGEGFSGEGGPIDYKPTAD